MNTSISYMLTPIILTVTVSLSGFSFADEKPFSQGRINQTEEAVWKGAFNAQPPTGVPVKKWFTPRAIPGETSSQDLYSLGISCRTDREITSVSTLGTELTAFQSEETSKALFKDNGQLEKLLPLPNQENTIDFCRNSQKLDPINSTKEIQRRVYHVHRVLNSSALESAKATGLNDKLIGKFKKIFAWAIDFDFDLQPGDEITVAYEQLHLDGGIIDHGTILAAEFIISGISHTALRYEGKNGLANYYSPDGSSLKKIFLRSPVESARITSHFNLSRRHPLSKSIRPHRGIDYAAPIGTPVLATGDGKIVFRGHQGGYGRVIVLQHGRNYSTLYAHLSKFARKARKGATVEQGQIIGYVGRSGSATGPHLHYEFLNNNVHQNPLTVELPGSSPIKDQELKAFKARTGPVLSQLSMYRATLLAQAH